MWSLASTHQAKKLKLAHSLTHTHTQTLPLLFTVWHSLKTKPSPIACLLALQQQQHILAVKGACDLSPALVCFTLNCAVMEVVPSQT